jgi:hypothetical protein
MTKTEALDVLASLALHVPQALGACLRGKPAAEVRNLNHLIGQKLAQRASGPTEVTNSAQDDAEIERRVRNHKPGGAPN